MKRVCCRSGGTAGPSTSLRFGRDDNSVGELALSAEIFDLKRICHPDRSAAKWRDLLFRSAARLFVSCQLTTGFADPRGHETGVLRFMFVLLSLHFLFLIRKPNTRLWLEYLAGNPGISLVFREMWGTL